MSLVKKNCKIAKHCLEYISSVVEVSSCSYQMTVLNLSEIELSKCFFFCVLSQFELKFCENLSFCVLSQFEYLSFAAI